MVTHDEVRKIAALAKLYIDESQLDAITEELNSVIAFADEVSSVDASGVDIDSITIDYAPLREDVMSVSCTPEQVLQNAMEASDGYFVVRERGGSAYERY